MPDPTPAPSLATPATLAAWKRQHDRAALVRARDAANAINDPLQHAPAVLAAAREEARRLTREIGRGPRGNRRMRRALWWSLRRAIRSDLMAKMGGGAS